MYLIDALINNKSIYPDNMKDAIIKPIYKNNNIQLITNYIPISL